MEFLEGETLHARLKRGRLAIKDAVRVGRQVAEALARKYRNDEKGLVAQAREKAQGVPLGQAIAQGPVSEPTGSVAACKKCRPATAAPQAKAKRRNKVAAAPAARARPDRTRSAGCPMLAWLQARL